MPKYCFPLSTFLLSVTKLDSDAMYRLSYKWVVVIIPSFKILLFYLIVQIYRINSTNTCIRPSIFFIVRLYHISVPHCFISKNHSGSGMVLETDQREISTQHCGWRVLQSYVPACRWLSIWRWMFCFAVNIILHSLNLFFYFKKLFCIMLIKTEWLKVNR